MFGKLAEISSSLGQRLQADLDEPSDGEGTAKTFSWSRKDQPAPNMERERDGIVM